MKSSQRNDWRFYFSCDTDICWKMYLRNIVRVCIGIGEIPLVGRLGILLDRWDCRFAVSNFIVHILLKLSFRYTVYTYIYIVWKKKKPSQNCLICNLVWKKPLSTMTDILLSKKVKSFVLYLESVTQISCIFRLINKTKSRLFEHSPIKQPNYEL